jgi:hypothetical protein
MKIITKAETLHVCQSSNLGQELTINSQADHTKEDDDVEVEDVRDPQCEA